MKSGHFFVIIGNNNAKSRGIICLKQWHIFLESFKGNYKMIKTFIMPRPLRKRGGKASKRGISKEQIAVLCAADRSNHAISEPACRGRVSSQEIEKVLR